MPAPACLVYILSHPVLLRGRCLALEEVVARLLLATVTPQHSSVVDLVVIAAIVSPIAACPDSKIAAASYILSYSAKWCLVSTILQYFGHSDIG